VGGTAEPKCIHNNAKCKAGTRTSNSSDGTRTGSVVLTTSPVTVTANTLVATVDVDGAEQGWVRVGVLVVKDNGIRNGSGGAIVSVPVKGLALEDCVPIATNVTDGVVSWKAGSGGGAGALSHLVGHIIQLQIELKDATAYAYGFAASN
jgi:hypothetical protein